MFNKTVAEGWRKRINPSDRKHVEEGEKEDLGYGIYQKELDMEGAWLCITVRRGKPRSPRAFRRNAGCVRADKK